MELDTTLISFSNLARVLQHAHMDTTLLVDDCLMPVQHALLNTIYTPTINRHHHHNIIRPKYYMSVAHDLRPFFLKHNAYDMYFVNSKNRSEIEKIVGQLLHVTSLSNHHLLFQGKHGCLFVGHQCRHAEIMSQLTLFASIMSLHLFIQTYYHKLTKINVNIEQLHCLINVWHHHPNTSNKIQQKMLLLIQEILHMDSIMEYMKDALGSWLPLCAKVPPPSPVPSSSSPTLSPLAAELLAALDVKSLHKNLQRRCMDLMKNVCGARQKLQHVRNIVTAKVRAELIIRSKSIDANFFKLVQVSRGSEQKATQSLDIMKLLFAASFSFQVLDRVSGGDFLGAEGVEIGNCSVCWVYDVFHVVVETPGLWWLLSMIWMLVLVVGCLLLNYYLFEDWNILGLVGGTTYSGSSTMSSSYTEVVTRRTNSMRLSTMLATKSMISTRVEQEWTYYTFKDGDEQEWGGASPLITLEVRRSGGGGGVMVVIHSITLSWRARFQGRSGSELMAQYLEKLTAVGV